MMRGVAPSAHNPQDTSPFRSGTPNATAAVRSWVAAQKLENMSPVKLNTDNRYTSLINRVIKQSLEAVPLEVTDVSELDVVIPRVFVHSLVRPTRRKDLPDIVVKSPDALVIHNSEGEEEYIAITYKNNIALITIPRDKRFAIRREDFAALAEHHDVKLRIARSRYEQFDTVFDRIDAERGADAIRQARRAERREQMAKTAMQAQGRRERSIQSQEESRKRIEAKKLANPPQKRIRGWKRRQLRQAEAGE